MTQDEKIALMQEMLGSDEDNSVLSEYLLTAERKIIDHRFPYEQDVVEIEPRFERTQIELAIVLYNQRGGEGQSTHSENGVKREWRTEQEILSSIPRRAGVPS